MRRIFKENAGLTLIELVVAMAIATVVTAAATSVLLFGLRINNQTAHTASQQMTVRQLLDVVGDIIAEGNVKSIEMNIESWRISDQSDKVVLSYLFDDETGTGAVYVGDYPDENENTVDGTPVLSNLLSSYVEMYDGLFTIHVETKEGIFSSSVLCRNLQTGVGEHDNIVTSDATGERLEFIGLLKTQYQSRGEIRVNGKPTDKYYSLWYCGGKYLPGWNEKTPWCACFISWALNEMGGKVKQPENRKESCDDTTYYKWYANVDEFMGYFQTNEDGSSWLDRGETEPKAGDLIFFDWNKGNNPQHMGVVLKVEEGTNGAPGRVYTIEGNSSGRVTVRSYSINDPRIIGYGVLPWTASTANGNE